MEGEEREGPLTGQEENGNSFVLNTKTRCFLCLEEITREKELEAHCFGDEENACIKIESVYSCEALPPPLSKSSENLSLLSIVRYLKIQWRSILNTFVVKCGGEVNTSGLDLFEKTPISVTLCNGCRLITCQLSSLCLELELLQMKVDHQLKCFHGVLKRSEEDVGLVDEFRRDLLRSSSRAPEDQKMSHVKLAEILRKEINNKCNVKVKNALPRVVLSRKKPNKLKNVLSIFNPIPDLPDVEFNMEAKIVAALGSNCELVNCAYCHHPQIPAAEYKQHKIRYHMETFLTQYKLPHISMSEFKEYCDYVFQVEVLLCQVQQQNPSSLKCSNCSKVYFNSYPLRHHLLIEHGELLGKKLGELQRSTTLEEIRTTQLPSSFPSTEVPQIAVTAPAPSRPTGVIKKKITAAAKKLPPNSAKGEYCKLCIPPTHVKYRNLGRHTVRAHVESYFTSYQLPHLSMSEFKQYCEHVIQVELLSCEKKYWPDGSPFFSCSLCSKNTTNNIILRSHLVTAHEDILSGKLMELQNGTTIAEINDAAKELSTLKLSGWACIKCGANFSQESTLYIHLKSQCRLRGPSTTRIVKRKRMNKIFRKRKRETVVIEGHYACQFCERTFNTRQAKYHHRKKYHANEKVIRGARFQAKDNLEGDAGNFVESFMYPKIEMELGNDEDMVLEQGLENGPTFSGQFESTCYSEEGGFKQQHQDMVYSDEVMVNNKMAIELTDGDDPLQ